MGLGDGRHVSLIRRHRKCGGRYASIAGRIARRIPKSRITAKARCDVDYFDFSDFSEKAVKVRKDFSHYFILGRDHYAPSDAAKTRVKDYKINWNRDLISQATDVARQMGVTPEAFRKYFQSYAASHGYQPTQMAKPAADTHQKSTQLVSAPRVSQAPVQQPSSSLTQRRRPT